MWGIDFARLIGRDRPGEKHAVRVDPRLSGEDQRAMFAFVRSILHRADQNLSESGETEEDTIVFSDADRPATLSVAFWIGGVLRGCWVVSRLSFKEALREAAFRAAKDPRFKPVGKRDLAEARIEITLLSLSQTMPVYQWKEQKEVNPEKGYHFSYQNRQGWLLPEVFNCLRFRGMDDFLKTLITEKAGCRIDKGCLAQGKIEIFETEDYIESAGKERILSLAGPLVQSDRLYTTFDSLFLGDLNTLLHQAAEQLLRAQEEDGNIQPIINPLSGKIRQVDWIRLALSATALAMLGETTGRESYRIAAEKAGEYVWKYGYNHPYLDIYTKTLCRVYYAEYLWIVGRADEAKSVAWEILKQIHLVRFEPIFLLKVVSLLLLFEEQDFFKKSETIFDSVWNDFVQKKNQHHVELARFPELIVVADKLFFTTGEYQYREKSLQVTSWLIDQQHQNGSFPSVTGGSDFSSYTRGTGKIFEVLALDPKGNQESILWTFRWLRDMQYTRESTFFVQSENCENILGGFRHDVFNQEVWIDGSAHVLIGGARLLRALKKKNEVG